jgi:carbon-monoxide dehydrogenase medium subunit
VAVAAVALGGIADRPLRVGAVEDALQGNAPTTEAIEAVSRLVADSVIPVGDIHASEAYRAHLGEVLTKRALHDAVERARIS